MKCKLVLNFRHWLKSDDNVKTNLPFEHRPFFVKKRKNIKFCYKLKKTPEMLVKCCGSSQSAGSAFASGSNGKEKMEDPPHSGRPSTSRTADVIKQVLEILVRDQQLTLRLIEEDLRKIFGMHLR